MAEKIVIAELDLNTEALIKNATETKQRLEQLKASLSGLKDENGKVTEAYVKQEARIKALSTEYNSQKNVIVALADADGKLLQSTDALAIAIDKENMSLADARKNNTELLKIRNELNIKTPEGAKQLELVNQKLDENNAFIKENVSAYEKQKIGIGDYKTAITDALGESNLFGGQLGELKQGLTALTGTFGLLKTEFKGAFDQIKGATKGTEELTTAQKAQTIATNVGSGALKVFQLALLATGIGVLIAGIALLIGYFKTFDPLVDKIEQSMAGLGAAVRVVQQALAGLLSLDFSGFSNLAGNINKAAEAAAKLKEAQQDLADQQIVQNGLNKEQQAQIDRLILQSKDRGKTEAERIALLQKAEKINSDNFKANSILADKEFNQAIENARNKGALNEEQIENLKKYGLSYAKYLLNNGKIEDKDVDRYKTAIETKIAIFSRGTAEQEKIQNRTNALIEKADAEKEKQAKAEEDRVNKAIELRKKNLADIVEKLNLELELYKQSSEKKAGYLENDLKVVEQTSKKQIAIAQAEYNASEKTANDKLKLQISLNEIQAEKSNALLEIVKQNSKADFDLFVAQNKSKLDSTKLLSQEIINEEKKRLEAIQLEKINQLELDKNVSQVEIDNKIANNQLLTNAEKEFQTQRIAINDEASKTIVANQKALDEQVKQQKAEQLQADKEIAVAQAETDLEAELLNIQNQYDAELELLKTQRDKEFLTEEQYLKKKQIALAKAEDSREKARILNTARELDSYVQLGNGLQALFGKNKDVAIALALIDTASSALKAYGSQLVVGDPSSVVRGYIAAAAATTFGLANVANISKQKFAKGVIGVEGDGTGTSDSIDAKISRGESVITARATQMFAPLLSAMNYAGGGVGEPLPMNNTIFNNSSVGQNINYDELASAMSKVNIVTDIQEVISVANNVTKVIENANF